MARKRGLVGSCVFVPQAWNGPKQGRSGAKTFREDVLFVLVAGSSSHGFEAVAVGTAEGERCRGRRPARWMQRMMQLGLTAEVEGKAREKEAFHVGNSIIQVSEGETKTTTYLNFLSEC